MDNRQKLGYMALGAAVLAVGIVIGQFMTPDIEAQNNGVFDHIVCRRLGVVNDNGDTMILLSADKNHNAVYVYDAQSEGNKAVVLTSNPAGNGVYVFDKQDDPAANLASYQAGNVVYVYDELGNKAVSLTSKPAGNGVLVRNNLTGEVKRLD